MIKSRTARTSPPKTQNFHSSIRDGTRASSVLVRIRGLLRRGERLRERSDINDIIREVIALSDGELRRTGASLRTEMPGNLPSVIVDRVLLQQVILNLMMNAVEAMRTVSDRARVLRIRTEEQPSGSIVVLVQDSGVGLDPKHSARMFEAFYTTKVQGIGMGLTISRSIIEAHGGRLWAVANDGPGSVGESCKRCGPDRWQSWCGWQRSWAFLLQRTSRFTPTCICRSHE
jgi:C4-dicarboxylate-specific signal transduction histidine kinase